MSGAVATQAQPTPQPVTLPTVAVFDSGVSSDAKLIEHFVKSRDPYVLPPDTNYEHGTAVASLVAGGAFFNDKHAWIPTTPAYVHDVCALEVSGSYMSDLELRLQSAVKKRPDVKVWNISIGGEACDDSQFSDIAMALDQLSDKYQVLFVVAAGNYNDLPRREWQKFSTLADRISSPGESVRALTVVLSPTLMLRRAQRYWPPGTLLALWSWPCLHSETRHHACGRRSTCSVERRLG